MKLTRTDVANKIAAYLRHDISFASLVDWSERAMMEAEFEETEAGILSSTLSRLGLADVRAFGLTWEDFEALLRELGFEARISLVAV